MSTQRCSLRSVSVLKPIRLLSFLFYFFLEGKLSRFQSEIKSAFGSVLHFHAEEMHILDREHLSQLTEIK